MPRKLRRVFVRLTQPSFTISAVGVVLDRNGKVLLLKHVLRANRSGWGLPGGFLNANEHPEKAIRRELNEEAGIEVGDLQLLKIRPLGNHLEIIYLCRIETGVASAKSSEILDARWFDIDEIRNVLPHFELEHILQARRVFEKSAN